MQHWVERVFWSGVSLRLAALACLASTNALGHEGDDIDEVIVVARSEPLVGAAISASQGAVGFDDIRLPPLLRIGELVEAVPGMVATQHSGTGKANQYFLRGFNLDHGTDFSARVNGVPINLRSHGHGQGYLDLNFMIPELVERTTYQKGPYHPDSGDFSSAGSVSFDYVDALDTNMLKLGVGDFGHRRGLVAGTLNFEHDTLTAAVDVSSYDGPWDLEENGDYTKTYLSYATHLGQVNSTFSLSTYNAEWSSTDQIPMRLIDSGTLSRLGFVDPDLGGNTDRYELRARFDFENAQVTTYATRYEFNLFSNFTYELDNPVDGDEFEQVDQRNRYGVFATGRLRAESDLPLMWGTEIRIDDIEEVGLFDTASRERLNTVRSDEVRQQSASAWVESELRLGERFRVSPGVRFDHMRWDVDALRTVNSGDGSDTLLSPTLNAAFQIADNVELYANWGMGFHTNDVRGAEISLDPRSSEAVAPVDSFVRSRGAELGLRWEQGEQFNITATAFNLELDSELLFVGDAGTTEPVGSSTRRGVELNAFWQPMPEVVFNAGYSYTDAEFDEATSGGVEIPGAIAESASLGATWAFIENGFVSVRGRYLGDAPLIEDGSVKSGSSLLVNLAAGYRWEQVELRMEAFNLTDSTDNDIAYFFASRLGDEPAEGVEDIHMHPLEPRALRASVTFNF